MKFIADGPSRRDTAVLLVGTADEFGIPQREISAVDGGFEISDALAAVLDKERKPKKKTSGNRAAKTSTKDKE